MATPAPHASAAGTGAEQQPTNGTVPTINRAELLPNVGGYTNASCYTALPTADPGNGTLFDDEESWNLQLIASKSQEYADICRSCPQYLVEAVYAVRNKMIEQRYEDAVAKTLDKDTFKAFHLVWHGTAADDDIIRTGFGVGGVDVKRKHGSAMGVGVYVTTEPALAASYSMRSTKNAPEFFRILRCELCETTDIPEAGGSVFVQPNKHLVRPIYVVHLRHRNLDPRNFGHP